MIQTMIDKYIDDIAGDFFAGHLDTALNTCHCAKSAVSEVVTHELAKGEDCAFVIAQFERLNQIESFITENLNVR